MAEPLAAPSAAVSDFVAGFAATRSHPPAWTNPLVTAGSGALIADEVLAHGQPQLDSLLSAFAHERRTDRRIAASQIFKSYAYWLTFPALAGWALHRRVPDVSAANITVSIHDRKPHLRFAALTGRTWVLPDDPTADHPDAIVVADEATLLRRLVTTVVDDHLFGALVAFRERGGPGNRILWGSIAVAFTNPFGGLTRMTGRDFRGDIDSVIGALGPAGRLIEMAQVRCAPDELAEPRPLRKTCCQKMRIPGASNCTNCPLISPERRATLSEAAGITWLLPSPALPRG